MITGEGLDFLTIVRKVTIQAPKVGRKYTKTQKRNNAGLVQGSSLRYCVISSWVSVVTGAGISHVLKFCGVSLYPWLA